jgi:hypothetical protein
VKRHVEGDTWERVTAEKAAADRLADRPTNGSVSTNGSANGAVAHPDGHAGGPA